MIFLDSFFFLVNLKTFRVINFKGQTFLLLLVIFFNLVSFFSNAFFFDSFLLLLI